MKLTLPGTSLMARSRSPQATMPGTARASEKNSLMSGLFDDGTSDFGAWRSRRSIFAPFARTAAKRAATALSRKASHEMDAPGRSFPASWKARTKSAVHSPISVRPSHSRARARRYSVSETTSAAAPASRRALRTAGWALVLTE